MPNHDVGHFPSSEQYGDATDLLAKYDFLLVFYGDLRATGKGKSSMLKAVNSADRNPREQEEQRR